MRRFGKPIAIVGLGNGARRLAPGLGSHPAGFVIWSGVLSAVKAAIDPSALPPTLVIANHEDKCQATPPEAVEPCKTWAGGKVRVLWVGGGIPGSTADQCNFIRGIPPFHARATRPRSSLQSQDSQNPFDNASPEGLGVELGIPSAVASFGASRQAPDLRSARRTPILNTLKLFCSSGSSGARL
jgi:hypothetical protein